MSVYYGSSWGKNLKTVLKSRTRAALKNPTIAPTKDPSFSFLHEHGQDVLDVDAVPLGDEGEHVRGGEPRPRQVVEEVVNGRG